MNYDHKKRTLFTTHEETQLLQDARKLLFEMFRLTGCRNTKIASAFEHLSILLEQYRYRRRERMTDQN